MTSTMTTSGLMAALDALHVAASAGLITDTDLAAIDPADDGEVRALVAQHHDLLLRLGFTPTDLLNPSAPAPTQPDPPGREKQIRVSYDATNDEVIVQGFLDDDLIAVMLVGAPGSAWHPTKTHWQVPASQAHGLAGLLDEPGWHVDEGARAAVVLAAQRAEQDMAASRATEPSGTLVIPGLNPNRPPLRPFQMSAIEYLVRKRWSFDCDPPGLGKTVTALSALSILNAFPAIIVTKAKLRLNWGREIEAWFPALSYKIADGHRSADLSGTDLVVINYDIVQYRLNDMLAIRPLGLVNDESQYVKERAVTKARMERYLAGKAAGKAVKKPPGSQRTWALKQVAADVRSRNGAVYNLTATPRPNRNRELWPQIEIAGLDSDLGGWKRWATRYCDLTQKFGREDANGSINERELNGLLRQIGMVARKKSEVLPQLPPLVDAVVEMTLDDSIWRRYMVAEADIVAFLGNKAAELATAAGEDPRKAAWLAKLRANYAKDMVKFTTLRQLAAQAKLASVIDWCRDHVTDNPLTDGDPTKLVVFGYHTDVQQALLDGLPGAVAIQSSDRQTDPQAEAAKAQFMEDPDTRFIVIGPGAMEGHTLTAAQGVAMAELPWNAAAVEQIAGRVFGRLNDAKGAVLWWLLSRRTVDQRLFELIAQKGAGESAVVHGDGPAISVEDQLLLELANRDL